MLMNKLVYLVSVLLAVAAGVAGITGRRLEDEADSGVRGESMHASCVCILVRLYVSTLSVY